MNELDKNRIIDRYNSRLKKYGYDIRTLASGIEERREIRYKILSEVGLKPGDSVLDLGCGFGDFYTYLKRQGINVKYTGYDINKNLIEIAKKNHPDVEFYVKDILIENFPVFDYIVSSSTFNLKLLHEDNYIFIERILKKCYNHINIGLAFDFLTSYVDFETEEAFHYQPEKLFAIAKQISKKVCLRHDYELFEFCIYIYKDFKGWK